MKKLGLLSMVLVLCLAVVGAGYAKWTDSVHVEGVVNTGSVEIGIRDAGVNDYGPHYLEGGELFPQDPTQGTADPNVAPGDNSEGKNVASIWSCNPTPQCPDVESFMHPMGDTEVEFYNKTRFEIRNAYPWYAPTEYLQIACHGTVPVKIQSVTFDCQGALGDYIKIGEWTVADKTGEVVATGIGYQGLIQSLQGIQLHYCDVLNISVQFIVTEYEKYSPDGGVTGRFICPMNGNATIDVDIEAVQWNEYVEIV